MNPSERGNSPASIGKPKFGAKVVKKDGPEVVNNEIAVEETLPAHPRTPTYPTSILSTDAVSKTTYLTSKEETSRIITDSSSTATTRGHKSTVSVNQRPNFASSFHQQTKSDMVTGAAISREVSLAEPAAAADHVPAPLQYKPSQNKGSTHENDPLTPYYQEPTLRPTVAISHDLKGKGYALKTAKRKKKENLLQQTAAIAGVLMKGINFAFEKEAAAPPGTPMRSGGPPAPSPVGEIVCKTGAGILDGLIFAGESMLDAANSAFPGQTKPPPPKNRYREVITTGASAALQNDDAVYRKFSLTPRAPGAQRKLESTGIRRPDNWNLFSGFDTTYSPPEDLIRPRNPHEMLPLPPDSGIDLTGMSEAINKTEERMNYLRGLRGATRTVFAPEPFRVSIPFEAHPSKTATNAEISSKYLTTLEANEQKAMLTDGNARTELTPTKKGSRNSAYKRKRCLGKPICVMETINSSGSFSSEDDEVSYPRTITEVELPQAISSSEDYLESMESKDFLSRSQDYSLLSSTFSNIQSSSIVSAQHSSASDYPIYDQKPKAKKVKAALVACNHSSSSDNGERLSVSNISSFDSRPNKFQTLERYQTTKELMRRLERYQNAKETMERLRHSSTQHVMDTEEMSTSITGEVTQKTRSTKHINESVSENSHSTNNEMSTGRNSRTSKLKTRIVAELPTQVTVSERSDSANTEMSTDQNPRTSKLKTRIVAEVPTQVTVSERSDSANNEMSTDRNPRTSKLKTRIVAKLPTQVTVSERSDSTNNEMSTDQNPRTSKLKTRIVAEVPTQVTVSERSDSANNEMSTDRNPRTSKLKTRIVAEVPTQVTVSERSDSANNEMSTDRNPRTSKLKTRIVAELPTQVTVSERSDSANNEMSTGRNPRNSKLKTRIVAELPTQTSCCSTSPKQTTRHVGETKTQTSFVYSADQEKLLSTNENISRASSTSQKQKFGTPVPISTESSEEGGSPQPKQFEYDETVYPRQMSESKPKIKLLGQTGIQTSFIETETARTRAETNFRNDSQSSTTNRRHKTKQVHRQSGAPIADIPYMSTISDIQDLPSLTAQYTETQSGKEMISVQQHESPYNDRHWTHDIEPENAQTESMKSLKGEFGTPVQVPTETSFERRSSEYYQTVYPHEISESKSKIKLLEQTGIQTSFINAKTAGARAETNVRNDSESSTTNRSHKTKQVHRQSGAPIADIPYMSTISDIHDLPSLTPQYTETQSGKEMISVQQHESPYNDRHWTHDFEPENTQTESMKSLKGEFGTPVQVSTETSFERRSSQSKRSEYYQTVYPHEISESKSKIKLLEQTGIQTSFINAKTAGARAETNVRNDSQSSTTNRSHKTKQVHRQSGAPIADIPYMSTISDIHDLLSLTPQYTETQSGKEMISVQQHESPYNDRHWTHDFEPENAQTESMKSLKGEFGIPVQVSTETSFERRSSQSKRSEYYQTVHPHEISESKSKIKLLEQTGIQTSFINAETAGARAETNVRNDSESSTTNRSYKTRLVHWQSGAAAPAAYVPYMSTISDIHDLPSLTPQYTETQSEKEMVSIQQNESVYDDIHLTHDLPPENSHTESMKFLKRHKKRPVIPVMEQLRSWSYVPSMTNYEAGTKTARDSKEMQEEVLRDSTFKSKTTSIISKQLRHTGKLKGASFVLGVDKGTLISTIRSARKKKDSRNSVSVKGTKKKFESKAAETSEFELQQRFKRRQKQTIDSCESSTFQASSSRPVKTAETTPENQNAENVSGACNLNLLTSLLKLIVQKSAPSSDKQVGVFERPRRDNLQESKLKKNLKIRPLNEGNSSAKAHHHLRSSKFPAATHSKCSPPESSTKKSSKRNSKSRRNRIQDEKTQKFKTSPRPTTTASSSKKHEANEQSRGLAPRPTTTGSSSKKHEANVQSCGQAPRPTATGSSSKKHEANVQSCGQAPRPTTTVSSSKKHEAIEQSCDQASSAVHYEDWASHSYIPSASKSRREPEENKLSSFRYSPKVSRRLCMTLYLAPPLESDFIRKSASTSRDDTTTVLKFYLGSTENKISHQIPFSSNKNNGLHDANSMANSCAAGPSDDPRRIVFGVDSKKITDKLTIIMQAEESTQPDGIPPGIRAELIENGKRKTLEEILDQPPSEFHGICLPHIPWQDVIQTDHLRKHSRIHPPTTTNASHRQFLSSPHENRQAVVPRTGIELPVVLMRNSVADGADSSTSKHIRGKNNATPGQFMLTVNNEPPAISNQTVPIRETFFSAPLHKTEGSIASPNANQKLSPKSLKKSPPKSPQKNIDDHDPLMLQQTTLTDCTVQQHTANRLEPEKMQSLLCKEVHPNLAPYSESCLVSPGSEVLQSAIAEGNTMEKKPDLFVLSPKNEVVQGTSSSCVKSQDVPTIEQENRRLEQSGVHIRPADISEEYKDAEILRKLATPSDSTIADETIKSYLEQCYTDLFAADVNSSNTSSRQQFLSRCSALVEEKKVFDHDSNQLTLANIPQLVFSEPRNLFQTETFYQQKDQLGSSDVSDRISEVTDRNIFQSLDGSALRNVANNLKGTNVVKSLRALVQRTNESEGGSSNLVGKEVHSVLPIPSTVPVTNSQTYVPTNEYASPVPSTSTFNPKYDRCNELVASDTVKSEDNFI